MVAGCHQLRPHWQLIFLAYFSLLAYGITVAIFNQLFITNCGYVCYKPELGPLFYLFHGTSSPQQYLVF